MVLFPNRLTTVNYVHVFSTNLLSTYSSFSSDSFHHVSTYESPIMLPELKSKDELGIMTAISQQIENLRFIPSSKLNNI